LHGKPHLKTAGKGKEKKELEQEGGNDLNKPIPRLRKRIESEKK